jgi:hypothetical protein
MFTERELIHLRMLEAITAADAGFETLQMRFFEESRLPRALVEHVRSERDAFVG